MTVLARLDEAPAEGVLVRTAPRADGTTRSVLVVRPAAGGVAVYDNVCPHLGAPLDGGSGQVLRKRDHIFCRFHFATFEAATGECVWGPCQGKALTPAPFRLDGDAVVLEDA